MENSFKKCVGKCALLFKLIWGTGIPFLFFSFLVNLLIYFLVCFCLRGFGAIPERKTSILTVKPGQNEFFWWFVFKSWNPFDHRVKTFLRSRISLWKGTKARRHAREQSSEKCRTHCKEGLSVAALCTSLTGNLQWAENKPKVFRLFPVRGNLNFELSN